MKFHQYSKRVVQKKTKSSNTTDSPVYYVSNSPLTTDTSDPENVLRPPTNHRKSSNSSVDAKSKEDALQLEKDGDNVTENDPIETITNWVTELENDIMPNLEAALNSQDYAEAASQFRRTFRYPLAIYAGGFKSFAKITFGGLTSLSFKKMQVMAIYQRFFVVSKQLNKIANKYDRKPAFYDVASRYRSLRVQQKQRHKLSKSKSPSLSGGTSRYGSGRPQYSGMNAIRAPRD